MQNHLSIQLCIASIFYLICDQINCHYRRRQHTISTVYTTPLLWTSCCNCRECSSLTINWWILLRAPASSTANCVIAVSFGTIFLGVPWATPLTALIRALLQNRPLFQSICPGSLWARDNRWLLSRVQRLAGSGGARPFVPVGDTNRDKMGGLLSRLVVPTGTKVPPFVPVGASNRDKRPCAPYPLPSPPARAIQDSAHLFSLFLARDRGVLAHFFTTFVKDL